MNKRSSTLHANYCVARALWGDLSGISLENLKSLTGRYSLSIAAGELLYLDGHWHVTHAGLLRLAQHNHCRGITVQPVREFCDSAANRWVFKATVYKSPGSRGFVGYGDADPSNVSALVRGAEMRMAETRGVNRALRKAYGIGLCSVEELGTFSPRIEPSRVSTKAPVAAAQSVSGNGRLRLRDRLCQLIRQHRLDPALVKLYATEFCGTENLRDATPERVEAFINNLAERATKDRAGLLCQLNSYARPQEAKL